MIEEKVVIYVDPYIDNFKCLGNIFKITNSQKTIKVTFTDTVYFSCDGTDIQSNADYFIYGPHSPYCNEITSLFKDKAIFINRLDKNHQAWNLLKIMGKIPNTLAIPTYWIGNGVPKFCSSKNDIVIKPSNGARGIGQFVLCGTDLAKWHSQYTLYSNRHINETSFLESVKSYSKYYPGKEKSQNEGIEQLSHGIFVQEKVKNIKAEYRAITGTKGNLEYLQYRERLGDDYKQATGSHGGSDDVVWDDQYGFVNPDKHTISNKILRTMSEIAKFVGPVQSIDFGVTDDNKVVVFEYCNQFGLDGVPYDIAKRIHLNAIKNLIGFKDDTLEVVKND